MKTTLHAAAVALGLFGNVATSLTFELNNEQSTKEVAATIAYGLTKFYTGNNTGDTPGNLPDPYFWWEAGAMFGTLVDYWLMTGDDSYVNITRQALSHQTGDTRDYMPENQTMTMGNDDQGFWAMAAMSAAENVFPNPDEDQPQYLASVQAVFNEYTTRWDSEHCGGGLRWQVFSFNNGWNYKNTISNGCFFNIAARLARYTGNSTYAEWADKIYQWQLDTTLIKEDGSIRDGLTIREKDCSDMDTLEWSYNAGIFLHGAAMMYNYTENDKEQHAIWKSRVDNILKHSTDLFITDGGIVYEQFCEPHKTCNTDQQSFKGYYLRWLTGASQVAPYTYETIRPIIETAAEAAVSSCTGDAGLGTPPFTGHAGTACGFDWDPVGTFDGLTGVGEQMNALSAVMYTLADKAPAPRTQKSGGTSKGDVNGGSSDSDRLKTYAPITTGDRVGAGFLTTLLCAGVLGGTSFLIL